MSLVPRIKFASAFSRKLSLRDALDDALGEVSDLLDAPADLVFVFFSSQFVSELDDQFFRVSQALSTQNVVGCTAESLICDRNEIEFEPGVAIWAASLPDVEIELFHLMFDREKDGGAFLGWPEKLTGDWPADSFLMTVADPFSFPMDVLLERLNNDRPATKIVGGMASGGAAPGDSQLVLGDKIFDRGAVVAHISGDIKMQTVLSQGCRPVGEPMVITQAEGNIIQELGGFSALEKLKSTFEVLPTREQKLMQTGLHIGRVVDELADNLAAGDFLVRNVIGFDEQSMGVVVADYFRPGQTVQFHIRDHETAHVDLQRLLSEKSRGKDRLLGGLAFSCNGRGSRLFETAGHDANLIQDFLGPIPVAGFFAAGEIGPVGGKNFMHGFTTSLALFERKA